MQYVKRVIVHPAFHNISFAEAEKLMDKMAQGEVIVRPSSKVDINNYFVIIGRAKRIQNFGDLPVLKSPNRSQFLVNFPKV